MAVELNIAPAYLAQDCPLTINEALDEFYDRNPLAIRETGDQVRDTFFHRHDIIHVVFGCDTTIHDEALADAWTIFGTDLGFRNYLSYLEPLKEDLKDIFDGVGEMAIVKESIRAVPDFAKVYWRARKMRTKWSWKNHATYLDQPLKDVRKQFNVRVIA